MLYFFRLLFLLINIDQETVLNWFGIENPNNSSTLLPVEIGENGYNANLSNIEIEPSTDISLDTLKLIIEGLWEKIQDGLTLADIENILFFILFIRFCNSCTTLQFKNFFLYYMYWIICWIFMV